MRNFQFYHFGLLLCAFNSLLDPSPFIPHQSLLHSIFIFPIQKCSWNLECEDKTAIFICLSFNFSHQSMPMPIPSLTFLDYFNAGGQYQWLQFLSILCQIPLNAPENQEHFRMEDIDDPGHFIKLPLEFGAHQQLRIGLFPSKRMESLKYTFSRMGKYSRSLPYNGVKARKMPCCTETIGTNTCNGLRNRRPLAFRKRCKADADFAILQCCQTCRTNVSELGRELFAHGLKSRHCFDRHNRNYCSSFIHQSGMWAANAGKLVNCNGESASLAFRVCRRSCGFCEPALYHTTNRNCTKGSGVNPTIKGENSKPIETDKKEGKGKGKDKENNRKDKEWSTEKPKVTSSSRKDGDNEKVQSNGTKSATTMGTTSIPSSLSTITTTNNNNNTTPPQTPAKTTPSSPITTNTNKEKGITSSSKMTENPSTYSPAPPIIIAPATLHSTVIPPTSPRLLPCPAPPPLPCLPPIPSLAPLTQATISIPQGTPRPRFPSPLPRSSRPPPLPPINPIMPPPPRPMFPHPLLPPPHPLPGIPFLPIPQPIMPIPRPIQRPRPPPPKITIEWKSMPPPPQPQPPPPAPSPNSLRRGGGGEAGIWPEWQWPLPDEVVEAILNGLSGIRIGNRGRTGEDSREYVNDEEEEVWNLEETIEAQQSRRKEHETEEEDAADLLELLNLEEEIMDKEEGKQQDGNGLNLFDLFHIIDDADG